MIRLAGSGPGRSETAGAAHGLVESDRILSFVAIDLETTGMDPAVDEIIQFGAVRVVGGRVIDRFVRTVRPHVAVPLRVHRLTGLTSAELEAGVEAAEALGDFLSFIAGSPLVGHNLQFDLAFLTAAAARAGLGFVAGPSYDTLTLARLLWPSLDDHRLPTLLKAIGLGPQRHRADTDAEATAELFLNLLDELSSLPQPLLSLVAGILRDSDDPITGLFQAAAEGARWRQPGLHRPELHRRMPEGNHLEAFPADEPAEAEREPVDGDSEPIGGRSRTVPLDLAEVSGYLEPNGRLAASFPGYERREGQVQLVRRVAAAFNDGLILLAEAGTGVGKSLAYLLPATLWATANGGPVIVSTHTINLQEQLASKDMPSLATALERPPRWTVVKGRTHYLCRRKWEEARDRGPRSTAEAFFIARLALWLTETDSGDRAELRLTPAEEEQWADLRADRETCLGAHCLHHGRDCFVGQARRRAEAADITIVNHSLLLADVQMGRTILPSYDTLIIDEAHNLEGAATENLGLEVDESEIHRRLGGLTRSGVGGSPGLLLTCQSRLRALGLPAGEATRPLELLEKAMSALRTAQRATRELFTVIGGKPLPEAEQDEEGRRTLRLHPGSDEFKPVAASAENLALHFETATGFLRDLAEALLTLGERGWFKPHPLTDDLIAAALWCGETADKLKAVARGSLQDYVYWAESGGRPGKTRGRLRVAPVEVGRLVRENLLDKCRAVVLTSATLTVAGDFGHLRQRLGLPSGDRRVEEISVSSPFDYQRQALLCIPRDLPPIHDGPKEAVIEAIGRFLIDLAEVVGGRTLVLFTSHRLMREVHGLIRRSLELLDICPYVQGIDGNRTHLVEAFRRDQRAILMGTASFWEGVDVPGPSLSCVVIVRLPFWPPNIPVLEARADLIRGRGGSPFHQLFLPLAVLRFKQGFGRLIRSRADRGVVIVLDGRTESGGSAYGDTFVRSLPGPRVLVNDSAEILAGAADWLAGRDPRVISRERAAGR